MNCNIDDVVIKEIQKFSDERGWLMELYRQDEIEAEFMPVMSYVSLTKPGVARGPHEHRDQADCFAFIGPSTFRLYLWDNREGSNTFGEKYTADLGESNPAMVIVPKGVVHAYKNIGEIDGIVFNAPNRLFAGQGKKEPVDEIRHEESDSSQFKID